ncbi:murein L,D-transpeptidase catalytic domain family protein [Hymenobacter taeanensis]|uniref:Murein L,D-transpeptidase catalytic domain family protein n=1 Tax=Hymenobacter taeanensis TaxID=2735321 RepID=A0A6M6BDS6_9BACT|nr:MULTISPECIES: murein L,D-transpeptidase catalytic domain family protein [Hymenobacter]QJX46110.1 murein L,D-transpeptidase catalytic domain family protein [Hymenobacter taeanensis]UOQ79969.1 murein L,D-transpeptidase catalytic domain family protein [Hymenobacter sp. 5414T-23]
MEKKSVVSRQRLKRRARRMARRVLPFVASLFLATPLAAPIARTQAATPKIAVRRVAAPTPTKEALYDQRLRDVYQDLGLTQQGLRYEVFEKAMTGYLNLEDEGKLTNDKQFLTVVDFSLPSTEKRLWVLDLAAKQVKFHTLVAHGHNSGENMATNFSNENESNMSSLGFYVTKGEYTGKHGRSLKLQGVDEGYNTNALKRSVVMHGADYVSEDFIKQYGRLGRSLGCPALPMAEKDAIIEAVNGGTCLFFNGPDQQYSSKYLNEDIAIQRLLNDTQMI